MTSNLRQLQAALANWTSADTIPDFAEGLALALLDRAEQAMNDAPCPDVEAEAWHQFLDVTRRSPFLLALPDAAHRARWAEVCFCAIRRGHYTLEDLIRQRVARHPDRPLFRHATGAPSAAWSYAQAYGQAQRFAATFLRMGHETPHVALWLANSIQGACCDIACLAFDISNTPISTHVDDHELRAIHDAVPFHIAVTDSPQRYARLVALRRQVGRSFSILRLDTTPGSLEDGDDHLLRAHASLGSHDVETALQGRKRKGLDEPATVMFTPGPEGAPKGVVFSSYNLLTKRFARAAALPRVGEDDLLLCYLPLFHTFGRFLEMMGAIFWGGTYVFASDPSIESLFAGLRNVRPTCLVSIPLRWSQIRRRILAQAGTDADTRALERACVRVTGGRLRWGLSAAGYLAPEVFRFFRGLGVALCSGFGMTEATGGVTMTPPDDYVDNSVGIPLPGMHVRLSQASELLISGPYVARPLDEPATTHDTERWIATGDLFRVRHDGHFEIFDKIKDIYKNTRGQTIAPRRVEHRFDAVPEARHVMLVGDGRDDNTLLVFPKVDAPGLEGLDDQDVRALFRSRILEANRHLAPYERVVDFAVVREPLSATGDVLRQDGTLHRKAVLSQHRALIESMYTERARVFSFGRLQVSVPRWLFRELGVLLDDLRAEGSALVDGTSGRMLRIERVADRYVRVGDLSYGVRGQEIDLGRLTRQPALWIGNAELTGFFPCKEGWDVSAGQVDDCPCLPAKELPELDEVRPLPGGYDARLRDAHRLVVLSFAAAGPLAATAVERLGEMLLGSHDRLDAVIVRRLRALADHRRAAVRSRAFRALLAYGPLADGAASLDAFLSSGRSFLSEDTLSYVASRRVEHAALQTLREAMKAWREAHGEPVESEVREQFEQIFEVLVHVSRRDLSIWTAAREELATWSLLTSDPELAAMANERLARLHGPLGHHDSDAPVRVGWQEQPTAMPELGKHPSDEQLQDALADQRFLAQSAAVLYESTPRPFRSAHGLVVTREAAPNLAAVRVGWTGRSVHADLVLTALGEDENAPTNARWRLSLRGASVPWPLVPPMGLWHERFDVVSTEMVDAPSVWDRIRLYATSGQVLSEAEELATWRALFVRGMAACFRVWAATGKTRMARNTGPSNVLMHLPDLAEHGCVRELEISAPGTSFGGVVDALDREFYERTARHYPWCRDRLSRTWLFDACVEALGPEAGTSCIEGFARVAPRNSWTAEAKRYVAGDASLGVTPLAAQHAGASFQKWLKAVPEASVGARAQTAAALCRLHGLDRFSDLVRYRLFRDTVFADQPAATGDAFDRLIEVMMWRGCKATELVELTALQNTIVDQELRDVLCALAFPDARATSQADRSEGRNSRGVLEVADDTGRRHGVRLSRRARDVSAVLHEAWRAGVARSYWSDESVAVMLDERGQAVGGALLRKGRRGDLLFDGPYLGTHLRGTGLDRALVQAISEHARANNAPVVRSVCQRPVRGAEAWTTSPAWGSYVSVL